MGAARAPRVPEVFSDHAARCRSALAEVPASERADAERVLSLVRARDAGEALDGESVRRELLGLIERLGRRASSSVPFATLARALSADLHGALGVRAESLLACDQALQLRGL